MSENGESQWATGRALLQLPCPITIWRGLFHNEWKRSREEKQITQVASSPNQTDLVSMVFVHCEILKQEHIMCCSPVAFKDLAKNLCSEAHGLKNMSP